jgi:hypothetical protein
MGNFLLYWKAFSTFLLITELFILRNGRGK